MSVSLDAATASDAILALEVRYEGRIDSLKETIRRQREDWNLERNELERQLEAYKQASNRKLNQLLAIERILKGDS